MHQDAGGFSLTTLGLMMEPHLVWVNATVTLGKYLLQQAIPSSQVATWECVVCGGLLNGASAHLSRLMSLWPVSRHVDIAAAALRELPVLSLFLGTKWLVS